MNPAMPSDASLSQIWTWMNRWEAWRRRGQGIGGGLAARQRWCKEKSKSPARCCSCRTAGAAAAAIAANAQGKGRWCVAEQPMAAKGCHVRRRALLPASCKAGKKGVVYCTILAELISDVAGERERGQILDQLWGDGETVSRGAREQGESARMEKRHVYFTS